MTWNDFGGTAFHYASPKQPGYSNTKDILSTGTYHKVPHRFLGLSDRVRAAPVAMVDGPTGCLPEQITRRGQRVI